MSALQEQENIDPDGDDDTKIERGNRVSYKGRIYLCFPHPPNAMLYPLGTPFEQITRKGNYIQNVRLTNVQKVTSKVLQGLDVSVFEQAPPAEELAKVTVTNTPSSSVLGAKQFNYSDTTAPGYAKNLRCVACDAPAFKPVTCASTNCGLMFCAACADGLPACPSCQTAPFNVEAVRIPAILKPLDELEVLCPQCDEDDSIRLTPLQRVPRHAARYCRELEA